MRFKSLALGGAMLASLAMGSIASAQTEPMQSGMMHKGMGQGHSNRSLERADKILNKMIEKLQQDRHDYGGNREKAVNDLQRAEADIAAALAYQQAHK